MSQRLRWPEDAINWPHKTHSEMVTASGFEWHIQRFEPPLINNQIVAPVALLLHGTGASSHSWAGIAPIIAQHYDTIAIDLPGHAFTQTPERQFMSIAGMANAIFSLLQTLNVKPAILIGHSAGAAIAIELCLNHNLKSAQVVSLNGALFPLRGVAQSVLSPMAKLMAMNPLASNLFSWRAGNRKVLLRLLEGTGSSINVQSQNCYAQLFANTAHVQGALLMMANWDLTSFEQRLSRLKNPTLLIAATKDTVIAPRQAQRAATQIFGADALMQPNLGHLSHEEDAQGTWDLILSHAKGLTGAQ
jgi:magnesium chelatase accessory protein